jgi:hypothetical protein
MKKFTCFPFCSGIFSTGAVHGIPHPWRTPSTAKEQRHGTPMTFMLTEQALGLWVRSGFLLNGYKIKKPNFQDTSLAMMMICVQLEVLKSHVSNESRGTRSTAFVNDSRSSQCLLVRV